MRFLVFLAALAWMALPAAGAEVQVAHEDGVDFSGFRTYAWQKGTNAARPEVQEWIVNAVERELDGLGLRKVENRRADVYVVTHAIAELKSWTKGQRVQMDIYDVGYLTWDTVVTAKGTLTVDLVEGDSQRPVWRGVAVEVMGGDPKPEKLRKLIDKVTRKMFKQYPSR